MIIWVYVLVHGHVRMRMSDVILYIHNIRTIHLNYDDLKRLKKAFKIDMHN